ncbi:MAG: TonB-dependent receptor [Flavobacteriales bacterium]|nr:TonB-dependent receptor [Flavobacteriales bacterium]
MASASGSPREVFGFLIDAQTDEPVQNALIVDLANQNNRVLSDSTGRFRLRVEGTQFEISHIYYDKMVVDVQGFENGSKLKMSVGEGLLLDVAVVGADKTSKTMKEQLVSVESIKPSLIQQKNPIQMDEIVNQVPGVMINDGQINIRNGAGWSYGAGTRALLLVDGMPLISGDAGSVLWSFVSTDNIGQMEVVKGASSVLYGSSALNGIINIRTLWPKAKPQTMVSLFSGVYNDAKRDGLNWTNKSLTSNGLRITDSRRKGKNDFVSSLEIIDDKGYRFGDFDKRAHLGLDYRRRFNYQTYLGFRGHFLTTENGSFLLWKSYDSGYNALNDNFSKTQGIKYRIDPFFKYYGKKGWNHDLKLRVLGIINNVDNGNVNNNQSNQSQSTYFEYQGDKKLMNWITITYGTLFTKTKTDSPLFLGVQTASNRAFYGQMDLKFKRINITVGRRKEKYVLNDYEEKKPVTRAGFNWAITKATFLRFSYGQGYRFPTIGESYITTNVGLLKIYSNPTLQSETGDNVEFGIKQGYKIKKTNGYLDVALFSMHYQNMMEFTFGQWSHDISFQNGFGLGFKSVNTGNTTIKGLDLSLVGETSVKSGKIKWLTGYTSSLPTIDDAHNIFSTDSTGKKLSYFSTSTDTSGVLKYRSRKLFKSDIVFEGKRFEIGYSIRYNSRIENIDSVFVMDFFTTLVTGGIDKGLALNPKGNWIMDARFAYKINKKYRIAVIVNNFTNKEYMLRPADIAAPRLVMLQLKATF